MNVYLIPTENATYKAQICNELPTCDAVLLTPEGGYPVPLWSRRYGSDMSSAIYFESANSRDELICKLNSLGQRRETVQKLWKYDANWNPNDDVTELFKSCYEYKSNSYWQKTQNA